MSLLIPSSILIYNHRAVLCLFSKTYIKIPNHMFLSIQSNVIFLKALLKCDWAAVLGKVIFT